ncbi:MAG: type 1 glutamine amidotransferase [Rhodospirillaceae bacterium]
MGGELKLVLAEGNGTDANDRLAAAGMGTNADQYVAAIRLFEPRADIFRVHPADAAVALPPGAALGDFDGLVIGGSGLFVRRDGNAPDVARQVDLVRSALEAGLPVLGSCWGLQVAVIAAGGDVGRSPNGREVGICRDIVRAGGDPADPFLAGKPPVYQSLAIHYDEVTQLPPGAKVLAANDHSPVQAATFEWGGGVFWGVQYHPEFDFPHMAGLIRSYGSDMVTQKIFADDAAMNRYCRDLSELAAGDGSAADDAKARLSADEVVADPRERRREIANWLAFCRGRAD